MTRALPFDRRAHPAGLVTGQWRCADGWTLRRLDWPGAAGSRRLLFLSGRADFGEKYLEAMAHWRARGWSVTNFDWRGQGGSRGGAGVVPLDALLGDLDGFVRDWAGGDNGYAVVAHSMGAHLALRLMLEFGWRPPAAALVAPMIAINTGPVPKWLARLVADAAVRMGLGERPIAHDPGRLRERLLTGSAERIADAAWWRAANPEWALGPPRWGWIAAALRSASALARAAATPPADLPPLLMLIAGRERLVDNRAARLLAARLGADARDFPTAMHELLREEDANRLPALATIDAFLDAVVPA